MTGIRLQDQVHNTASQLDMATDIQNPTEFYPIIGQGRVNFPTRGFINGQTRETQQVCM